ncbi:MAG: methylglyoxal reductase (NADPH-dependent) gre2 [Cirrosporium novae-zelandiae]|nr:MAG: methylglyoxal reductase (NADPH-dependent) gre2 [Cirrosporium novae-zelandiae]
MASVSHRVLLTGANGFVGSNILAQLLEQGFSIRSVVRSNSKADGVRRDHPTAGDKLDFAIVEDITVPGAFDKALKSTPPFDTVIHTASPFLFRVVNTNHEILDPAINGTTSILNSVKKVAPEVKRVIITSSFAAIGGFGQYDDSGKIYTDNDWNPVTWEQCLETDIHGAYYGSKKFAEKAAWNFVSEEKPNFDVVIINPPMVYGPLNHHVARPADLNESNSQIYSHFIDSSKDAEMPPNGVHLYCDVRDVALAHVKAVVTPEASNKRFLLTAGPVTSQEIADIFRKKFPELESRTPIGKPGANTLPETAYRGDSTPAKEILGIKFHSKESTFEDLGKQLLDIEKQA